MRRILLVLACLGAGGTALACVDGPDVSPKPDRSMVNEKQREAARQNVQKARPEKKQADIRKPPPAAGMQAELAKVPSRKCSG